MTENTVDGLEPDPDEVEIVDTPAEAAPAERAQPARKPRFDGLEESDADYSERVQKRIAQATRYRREAETAARAAEARAQAAEARAAELAKDYLTNLDATLQRDIEAAKAKQARAYTDSDGDAIASASVEMAELAARRAEVQRQKSQAPAPDTRAAQPTVSAKTQDYIDANPWFTEDAEAREIAIAAHKGALARRIQPDTPEYFEHITKRVKAAFPEHFEGETEERETEAPAARRAAPLPPVAGAQRTVPGATAPKSRLPSLTSEEAAMAVRIGTTPKAYAIEKARLAAGKQK